jgi:hypothetical protein
MPSSTTTRRGPNWLHGAAKLDTASRAKKEKNGHSERREASRRIPPDSPAEIPGLSSIRHTLASSSIDTVRKKLQSVAVHGVRSDASSAQSRQNSSHRHQRCSRLDAVRDPHRQRRPSRTCPANRSAIAKCLVPAKRDAAQLRRGLDQRTRRHRTAWYRRYAKPSRPAAR